MCQLNDSRERWQSIIKQKYSMNTVFDEIELCVANIIQKIQEEKLVKKSCSSECTKEYKKLWAKYGNYSPLWGWI